MTTPIGYFRGRIGVTPIPTPEEERDLARRRDAGDDSAREELIRRNVPLALGMAARSARVMPRWEGELVGASLVGLTRAAATFDPGKGARFATYATVFIRHELQAVRELESRLVAVPVNVQRARIAARAGQTTTIGSWTPPAALLALGDRAMRAAANGHGGASCDDGDGDPIHSVACRDEAGEVERAESVEAVRRAIGSLPPRVAEVVRLRRLESWTHRRIGERLGVSRERARQIEAEGLRRLRVILSPMESAS